ncbi:hypothetical protein [Rathayibacter sp. Leaf248]|uniref:hypothetical protein n=1 Tax=Rathayibacter sp. Leaf248 TaxID=2876555 RepID=UPI001E47ACAB|nr:hypothetical protein [Rathayibacter sp. Leaf248]
MEHIELVTRLHDLGRGVLSDAVTRAVNRGDLTVAPLPVRSATRIHTGRGRRSVDATVETAGVNAWLLDDDTAVALARGGILLRDPADGVFSAPTIAGLAEARETAALLGYLADAEELVVAVLGPRPESTA